MGKVVLEGMEFYAYHGFHPEERVVGNIFIIDLMMETDFQLAADDDNLSATVDYEAVYRLVSEEMQIPSKLLEHLGKKILDRLFDSFSVLEKATITVSKTNPPLGGKCQKASIVIEQAR